MVLHEIYGSSTTALYGKAEVVQVGGDVSMIWNDVVSKAFEKLVFHLVEITSHEVIAYM